MTNPDQTTPAERCVSKLRVVRATMLGLQECLTDALTFAERGIEKADKALEELGATFTQAGIEFDISAGRRKGQNIEKQKQNRARNKGKK